MSQAMLTFLFALLAILEVAAFILFARKTTADVQKMKESVRSAEKEDKLFKLYQSLEDMMDTFEEYVNETQEDIEKQRRELTELSRQAAVLFMRVPENPYEKQEKTVPEARVVGEEYLSKKSDMKTVNFRIYDSGAGEKANIVRPVKTAAQTPRSSRKHNTPPPQEPVLAGRADETLINSGLDEKDKEALLRFATKTQRVRYLISRGLAADDIARELDIGKGEVRLIADLGE